MNAINVVDVTGPSALVVIRMQTAQQWLYTIDAHPKAAELAEFRAGVLKWQEENPDAATERGILYAPELYSVYSTNSAQMPRYYATLGWLDEHGYRHTQPSMPHPTQEFLTQQWEELVEFEAQTRQS